MKQEKLGYLQFKGKLKHSKSFLGLLLILSMVITPFAVPANYNHENSANNEKNYTVSDIKVRDSQGRAGQFRTEVSVNGKQTVGSHSLGLMDSGDSFSAQIDTENHIGSDYEFLYNESETGLVTGVGNKYELSLNPTLENYTQVQFDVDTYTNEETIILDDNGGNALSMSNVELWAQMFILPELAYSDSIAYIHSFNVTESAAVPDLNVYGAIYSAFNNSNGNVTPDALLGSVNVTTDASTGTLLYFKFTNPIEINTSITHTTATGGYFYFVLYRDDDSLFDDVDFEASNDATFGDNGTTIFYNSGATNSPIVDDPDEWDNGVIAPRDLSITFNSSFEFNPLDLETQVAIPVASTGNPVLSDGIYVENIFRSYLDIPTYNFTYNPNLFPSHTIYQNISYVMLHQDTYSASVFYSENPTNAIVNWNITLSSSTYAESNVTKYFVLPSSFTVTQVYNGVSLLIETTHYTVSTLGNNVVVYILIGAGDYIVRAQTNNELYSATLETYVESGGAFTNQSFGYSGTLYPNPPTVGDQVKANITNMNGLDLSLGNVNSSLRDNNGILWGNMSIGAYLDTSYFNESVSLGSVIEFITYLDPNIPSGIWSFQFRWFNGTAAGSTAIEFVVRPQVDLNLISPSPTHELLEGDNLSFELATLDLSHNSTWVTPTYSWELDGSQTLMTPNGAFNETHDSYIASVAITVAGFPALVPSFSYTMTVNFTEGTYIELVQFSFTVYFRASTSLSGLSTVEYGSNFNVIFAAVNESNGGTNIDDEPTVAFDFTGHTITPSFIALDSTYDFSITWSNSLYDIGSNQILVNWSHPDFRESLLYTEIIIQIDFTVSDGTQPVFNSSPTNNTSYEETQLGNVLSWTIFDLTFQNYTVFNNTIPVPDHNNQPWTSATQQVDVSLDGLTIGIYNFTILIQDRQGNTNQESIWITIIDTKSPDLSLVGGPIYRYNMTEDGSGFSLTWNLGDRNPDNYTIFENGTIGEGPIGWSNGTINYDISHLKIYPSNGFHNITILVYDTSGNPSISEVTVLVTDIILPTIGSPGNQIREYVNTAGYTFQWDPQDRNNGTYQILVNGTYIYGSGSFFTGTPIPVTIIQGVNDTLGWYNYTLILTDPSGNIRVNVVILHIQDTTAPTITAPTEVSYDETDTDGILIQFSLNDFFNNPAYYNVTGPQGGELATGFAWTNNVLIGFPTGALIAGNHTFTIYAIDGNGNLNIHTITVQVNDRPVISVTSTTVTIEEGTTGNVLIFTPTDTDSPPDTYAIYVDGSSTPEETGSWTNNTDIVFNIDFLALGDQLGDHQVNLTITDLTGLTDTVIIFVTVQDVTSPVFLDPVPTNFGYTLDTEGELQFIGSDLHADDYVVYVGDVEYNSSNWMTGTQITVLLTGFDVGIYNVTIVLFDSSDNSVTISINVQVQDPDITYTQTVPFEITNTVYEGDVETLQMRGWETIEDQPIIGSQLTVQLIAILAGDFDSGEIVQQFIITDTTGLYDLVLNYTGLAVGTYQWVFLFEKDLFESQTISTTAYSIEILPHKLHVEIQLEKELRRNQEFPISVTITYDNPERGGLSLNTITGRAGPVKDIELRFTISYTTLEDRQQNLVKGGTTNVDGIVNVILTRSETENIKSIDGISITSVTVGGFEPINSSVPSEDLPEISDTNTLLVLFQDAIEAIRNNALIVILSLVSLITLFIFVSRRRKRRREIKKSFIAESENAATELDGLMSIKAILITAGNTGIPFFESSFEGTKSSIDLTLVSGITSALSTFMGELASSPIGFETMEKENLTITSHKSEKSTIVVISNVHLPLVILDQIREGHRLLEAKHSDLLENPEQAYNIDPVEIKDDLEIAGLKLSLKGGLRVNERNLKRIAKQTSLTRKLRSNVAQLNELIHWNSPDPMSIDDVLDHLKKRSMDHPLACRVIYLAYHNDVFFIE